MYVNKSSAHHWVNAEAGSSTTPAPQDGVGSASGGANTTAPRNANLSLDPEVVDARLNGLHDELMLTIGQSSVNADPGAACWRRQHRLDKMLACEPIRHSLLSALDLKSRLALMRTDRSSQWRMQGAVPPDLVETNKRLLAIVDITTSRNRHSARDFETYSPRNSVADTMVKLKAALSMPETTAAAQALSRLLIHIPTLPKSAAVEDDQQLHAVNLARGLVAGGVLTGASAEDLRALAIEACRLSLLLPATRHRHHVGRTVAKSFSRVTLGNLEGWRDYASLGLLVAAPASPFALAHAIRLAARPEKTANKALKLAGAVVKLIPLNQLHRDVFASLKEVLLTMPTGVNLQRLYDVVWNRATHAQRQELTTAINNAGRQAAFR